ncbi:hypothetical protein [Nocardiopsis salina]|uniref:hypothetical protein n=1 Tax=Nocardiopsis salina TaxID=245836 RepID=UPI0009FDC62C|nr:hypothetical protein [Nocardiopsis salina]
MSVRTTAVRYPGPQGGARPQPLPRLGAWQPELGVHVVVRAEHGCDPAPLLACLAAQTYPSPLTEVTVVGDVGTAALEGERPDRTQVVPSGTDSLWRGGPAAPPVVLWMDAGDLVPPGFVEAHLRGHHAVEGLVLCSTPGDAAEGKPPEADRGLLYARPAPLWDGALRSGVSAPRSLLEACAVAAGGELPAEEAILLHLLLQHGALTATDPEARHCPGTGGGTGANDPLTRARVAHWVPDVDEAHGHRGAHPRVPMAEVVVETAGADSATVVDTVDRLLGGDTTGSRFTLTAVPGSPEEADLLAHFRADPRVRTGSAEPAPDPLVPFVLRVPAALPAETDVVRVLVEEAERSGADVVRAAVPGSDLAGPRLERTAAHARSASGRRDHAPVVHPGPLPPRVRWIDGEVRLLQARGAAKRRAAKWARLHELEQEVDRMRGWEQRLRYRFDLLTRTRAGRLLCRILG